MFITKLEVFLAFCFNILFWYNFKFVGSCKKRTERFCVLFTQFPPVVTSYIAIAQYPNQEININTNFLLWNLQMYKNVERILPLSNTIIIPKNINSMSFFWTVVLMFQGFNFDSWRLKLLFKEMALLMICSWWLFWESGLLQYVQFRA